MFDHIGEKIKSFVKVIFYIGAILSVIIGIVAFSQSIISGILIIGLGILGSWVSSFVMYGFGEIVSNSEITRVNTTRILKILSNTNATTKTPDQPSRGEVKMTTSWICDKCNADNSANSFFCVNCGNKRPMK